MKANFRLILNFLLIILFSGCLSSEYDPTTHQQEYFIYSSESERAMGLKYSRMIKKELTLIHDPRIIKRINRIGDSLVEVCPRRELTYFFSAVDEDEVNAFAIPGGHIYIYNGMLEELSSDDEVAAVLAHEIAHVVARHSIKRLQAAIGANILMLGSLAVQSEGNIDAVSSSSIVIATMMSKYSQEDELLADKLAVQYMADAGYDPKAALAVMDILKKKEKESPLRFKSYFRSHPYTSARIKQIKEELRLPLSLEDLINS